MPIRGRHRVTGAGLAGLPGASLGQAVWDCRHRDETHVVVHRAEAADWQDPEPQPCLDQIFGDPAEEARVGRGAPIVAEHPIGALGHGRPRLRAPAQNGSLGRAARLGAGTDSGGPGGVVDTQYLVVAGRLDQHLRRGRVACDRHLIAWQADHPLDDRATAAILVRAGLERLDEVEALDRVAVQEVDLEAVAFLEGRLHAAPGHDDGEGQAGDDGEHAEEEQHQRTECHHATERRTRPGRPGARRTVTAPRWLERCSWRRDRTRTHHARLLPSQDGDSGAPLPSKPKRAPRQVA